MIEVRSVGGRLFRGSSRFESLISSHHSKFTCECNKEMLMMMMMVMKQLELDVETARSKMTELPEDADKITNQ